ncbi:MAG TPA: ABC transporter permease, partial [Bryobacteraceae bacterium]|nr:ABC transporter permease [Bryobacteraceae bacterium]
MMSTRSAGALRQDLLYAARALRRTPGFTVIVIVCLALGTGANTAIFSLLDQVLLRNLPVRDPERLVVLHRETQMPGRAMADNMETVFSVPAFNDLRQRVRVFDSMVARTGLGVTLTGAEATRANAELVSGNFFDGLGVRPQLGRVLEPADDPLHAPRAVAVLSNAFWMRHFGGSPAALNATLRLNGVPVTVVGVADSNFQGVMRGNVPDLFLPLGLRGQLVPDQRTWADDRSTRFVNIFARVKSGMTREQALAGLRAVYQPMVVDELAQFHRMSDRERQELLRDQIQLNPAADGINMLRGEWQKPILALAAIAGLVLLIACANISGLILARAASREKDIGVRLALGAGRFAVGRPFLLESIGVAVAGACCGLLVAQWSIAGLLRLMPGAGEGNAALSAAIDWRMLVFSLVVAVVTGVLAGLAPAFQASRQDIAVSLGSQTRSATSSRTALRRLLVAGQLALCVILLVAAGLFTRSLYNISRVDVGFRPAGITVFSLSAADSGYDLARSFEFYRQVHDRLAAIPGVQSVASSGLGPFMDSSAGTSILIDGYTEKPGEDKGVLRDWLSPGYFSTLGTPMIAGREFTDADRRDAPPVAIVNEEFARKYLGGNALGRRIRFNSRDTWMEVVGVVRNMSWMNVRDKVNAFAYTPWAQEKTELNRLNWFVRSAAGYRPAADIRRIVHQLDANVPVDGLQEYTVRVAAASYVQRLLAILAGVFGGLATLLAALGLYALIAWSYAQRKSEIGIRIALGASPGKIARMVAREVGALALFGIIPGLAIALLAGALVATQLFGVSAHDPVILAGASIALLVVSALAAMLPAVRA